MSEKTLWNGVRAWLAANVIVGTVTVLPFAGPLALGQPSVYGSGAVGVALLFMFFATLTSCAATAIPAFLLVGIARAGGWPRGWTDTIIPAALAFFIVAIVTGEVGEAATVVLPLWFGIAGAIGGYAYWRIAGRPRPPYPHHPLAPAPRRR